MVLDDQISRCDGSEKPIKDGCASSDGDGYGSDREDAGVASFRKLRSRAEQRRSLLEKADSKLQGKPGTGEHLSHLRKLGECLSSGSVSSLETDLTDDEDGSDDDSDCGDFPTSTVCRGDRRFEALSRGGRCDSMPELPADLDGSGRGTRRRSMSELFDISRRSTGQVRQSTFARDDIWDQGNTDTSDLPVSDKDLRVMDLLSNPKESRWNSASTGSSVKSQRGDTLKETLEIAQFVHQKIQLSSSERGSVRQTFQQHLLLPPRRVAVYDSERTGSSDGAGMTSRQETS
jgi:hypothetical protein